MVKALQKDYKTYAAGDTSKADAIKAKNAILRALLSNQLGYLNQAREDVLKFHNSQFENLTGFRILHHQAPEGQPSYYLSKLDRHDEIAKTVKPGEYVTVLVPLEYDFNIVPRKSFQRLIPVPQPGLEEDPTPKPSEETSTPKTTEPIVETVTITESPVTTTVERPQEVVTTVTEPGTTITQPGTTITQPGTTVTEPGTTCLLYTSPSPRD